MPETMTRMIESVKLVWSGLGMAGRVLVLLVGGGALATLLWPAFSANRPDMVTLFSQFNPSDASAIVDELKSSKVAYRVVDGGTRIMVPSGVVYETRLHLATRGLPQGDRKSTRLNSSHHSSSYAVFCLKKK